MPSDTSRSVAEVPVRRGFALASERRAPAHAIKHIVIIVQENRTVDNLFNGLPGADTVPYGKNTDGHDVELVKRPLAVPYDLSHKHPAWVQDYDGGKMDGFNTEIIRCIPRFRSECPPQPVASYGYVARSQVQPYWDMAEKYTFADHTFETNQGPSFPAHQYLVSGTSAISNESDLKAAENPLDPPEGSKRLGGCDSLPSTTVLTIDPKGNEGNAVFPCFVRNSIFTLMDDRGVTWRYYQEHDGPGLWQAVDALKPIRHGQSYSNVIWPSERVLKDVERGRLADVTFITPSALASDHAEWTDGTGPSWVAAIVDAIGRSTFWDNTAIFVTWDDWGGWYDHVKPKIYNSYEDGFRVPLIVISPYAKKAYVAHDTYEFGSILKFIEDTFGLPSLHRTDVRAKALRDCFDFHQRPRPFDRIRAPYSATYFESLPIDYGNPDDDW